MIFITNDTDDYPAKYGYCICGTYNEVYRKDKSSICHSCNRRLIHFSSFKLKLIIATVVIIGFLWLNLCN